MPNRDPAPFDEGAVFFPIPEQMDATPLPAPPSIFAVGEMHAVLRGEIAAAHAYFRVMEKFREHRRGEVPAALQEIHDDHLRAAAYWKAQLREEGEPAEEKAGLWGHTVDTLVDAAGWIGDAAALGLLVEGEELGLRRYEMLLNQECLTPAQEDQVRLLCIPRQRAHIKRLRRMPRLPAS